MSQCSERVKHAVPPPFVSSGLFSSPAPVAGGGRPLRLFAARAGGQRATAGQRRFWAKNGKSHHIRLPSPFRPILARHIACGQARKTGNIYAATLTLYIACPAAQFAGLPALAPNRRFRDSAPCPAPYPFISHAFALPNPRATTKSTQIGHKLCMNRRNQPDLPACIALRA